MLLQPLFHPKLFIHLIIYIRRYAQTEIIYRGIRLQFLPDILRDKHHGISSVLHIRIEMLRRLARTAINHSDEIIGNYHSILTSLRALLSYDTAFYNLHKIYLSIRLYI
ncbi:Uncharacterised protein [Segatella copri]|nr:Uncharacterised protein [Segatella copri]